MVPPGCWDAVRAAGLEVRSLSVPRDGPRLTCPGDHRDAVRTLAAAIATARDAGIPQIVVFSGDRKGEPQRSGVASCARALTAVAPSAADAGVTLLFELLNTDDHPDYHACTSRFVFSVVSQVGSAAVRVLYDIYHATRMGEEAELDLRERTPLIGHVHVAGAPRRDFPGPAQRIDYRRLVTTARSAGYAGWWGHEFRAADNPVDEYRRSAALMQTYASAVGAGI
jgi:hydroxypyruvate isomerase